MYMKKIALYSRIPGRNVEAIKERENHHRQTMPADAEKSHGFIIQSLVEP